MLGRIWVCEEDLGFVFRCLVLLGRRCIRVFAVRFRSRCLCEAFGCWFVLFIVFFLYSGFRFVYFTLHFRILGCIV